MIPQALGSNSPDAESVSPEAGAFELLIGRGDGASPIICSRIVAYEFASYIITSACSEFPNLLLLHSFQHHTPIRLTSPTVESLVFKDLGRWRILFSCRKWKNPHFPHTSKTPEPPSGTDQNSFPKPHL